MMVVRCFEDDNVVHVDGSLDPLRDIEVIELELIYADLEAAERRLKRTQGVAKSAQGRGEGRAGLGRAADRGAERGPARPDREAGEPR